MSSTSTMVEKLQKFFKYCLSKLKNSHPQIHPSSPHSSSSSPLKRILSGCKHPKTPSFSIARGGNERNHNITDDNDDAATLSDVDQFLFENFKSLFLGDDEPYTTDNTNNTTKITDDGDSESNHSDMKSRYDQVYPMLSPDLLNDVRSSGSGESSIVLLAWSENVYEDFRRSMKGMVDARLRSHGRVDWGFMEELLLCYLNLNEKKSHKFVLSAYVDLINGFRDGSSSPEKAETAAPVKRPMSVRTFRSRREIGMSKVGM